MHAGSFRLTPSAAPYDSDHLQSRRVHGSAAPPKAKPSVARVRDCRLRRVVLRRAGPLDPESLTDRDMSIASLVRWLDQAIEDEDFSAAAQLRDEIAKRRFDNRLAIEEANEAFYAAFTSGNLAAMSSIWGSGEHVQCIHPAAGCIAGRTSVLESWKLILGSGRVNISLEDVRVYADESSSGGFVTCIEVVDAGDTRGRIAATNIFEKQKGAWKIVHHHGSAAPRIL